MFDAATGSLLHSFVRRGRRFSNFGQSVAISGNNILIGTGNNRAHLFNAATGSLLQTFLNPTPAKDIFFGFPVAISDNNVLITAYQDDAGTYQGGVVHFYTAVPEPLTLLGAGTALGFGAFFKRKLTKAGKSTKIN